MNRKILMLAVYTFVALLVSVVPSFAQTVKEPSSGVEFPATVSIGNVQGVITGTGIRKKYGFKVYAIASYIDGSKLDKSRDIYSQLLADGPSKQIIMHFVRNVDVGKIKEAFQEGLEKNVPNYNSSPSKQNCQAFLNAMADLATNQEIVLQWTGGGYIGVIINGQSRGVFQDQVLAKAVWSIWLGGSPISDDIKTGLIANAK